jgi:uncharacterized protein YxeA
MRWSQSILGATAFVIAIGCAAYALPQGQGKQPQGKQEEQDQILKMTQVPQKVQQAIKAYASAAEIKQITRGDVDGTIAYEFQIEKGGRKSEVSITPDGKLLTSEEEVPLAEIPDAARALINAQAAGGRVVSTEKVVEHGKTAFEAVIEKGGKQAEISVSPDGKIVGSSEDVPLSDIPAAAQKVIVARAAGGKIVSTKKVLEDGKTVFAAVIEKAGKQQEITVTPEGKIVDTETIKH